MTAEIAILNKEAIALAADSAATVQTEKGQKIFTSANKLFALSKFHPVGIMVYGSANFMEVPWEIIIKKYRRKLGYKKYKRLDIYAKDFIKYLGSNNGLFPQIQQLKYYQRNTASYFYEVIRREIFDEVDRIIKQENTITNDRIHEIARRVIDKQHSSCTTRKGIISHRNLEKKILSKYKKEFLEIVNSVFEKIVFDDTYIKKLVDISICLFTKDMWSMLTAGIVIAGFGEDDIFPSLKEYKIEGIICGELKYYEKEHSGISFSNSSVIIPFAQGEMVATFMEGMDPGIKNRIEGFWAEIFKKYPDIIFDRFTKQGVVVSDKVKEQIANDSQKIFNDYLELMKTLQRRNYIDPVVSVVGLLPKDELAMMAEALVNLTSVKRKVTTESETVGGPIDVVLISKGDGFIWVKRKHYFKPELNPQFFKNYKER